jgi:hypothetical protein
VAGVLEGGLCLGDRRPGGGVAQLVGVQARQQGWRAGGVPSLQGPPSGPRPGAVHHRGDAAGARPPSPGRAGDRAAAVQGEHPPAAAAGRQGPRKGVVDDPGRAGRPAGRVGSGDRRPAAPHARSTGWPLWDRPWDRAGVGGHRPRRRHDRAGGPSRAVGGRAPAAPSGRPATIAPDRWFQGASPGERQAGGPGPAGGQPPHPPDPHPHHHPGAPLRHHRRGGPRRRRDGSRDGPAGVPPQRLPGRDRQGPPDAGLQVRPAGWAAAGRRPLVGVVQDPPRLRRLPGRPPIGRADVGVSWVRAAGGPQRQCGVESP